MTPEEYNETIEKIKFVLDDKVAPSVAAHNGKINFLSFSQEGVLKLQMAGSCAGCAMSQLTLKQGVEVMIKDKVPGITEVIDVTDHAAGTNPFY